jgi:GTP-binding protein EngB required for normal cell division
VATKTDKLSSNELTKQIRLIETDMPESKIISYSAQSGKGRDSVWSAIAAALK